MNKKLFTFKIIFCLTILFSFNNEVKASHAVGADLTYVCLGGNSYRFFYTLYRDCDGIPVQSAYTINGSSTCGGSLNFTVQQDSSAELVHTCSTAVSRCVNASSPHMGIQAYYYHADVTLPSQCNKWTFGYAECCRNAAITNLVSPSSWNLYVEATINNAAVQCNSSPTFANMPVAFICAGEIQYFNHGAYDIDGDSLAFQMITPLSGPGAPVTYIAGLSAGEPVTYATLADTTRFNPITGDIRMKADGPQITVIAVLVSEYRNGVLIGTVERDIQIIVENCTNHPPTLSGINGTPSFIYTACANTPFCFYLRSADIDALDWTAVTWNGGIPTAAFSTSSTQRDSGFFCWTPTDADTLLNPHIFTATVTDNSCPTFRSNTYSYIINVRGVVANAGPDQTVACGATTNLSATAAGGNGGSFSYLWLPSNTVGQNLNGVGVGNYNVIVSTQVSTNPALTCHDTDEVLINPGTGAPTVDFSSAMQGVCSYIFHFTDLSTVAGGGSILTWDWDFGDPASGANNTSAVQNPNHTFSGPGSYTVTLEASAGAGCDGQFSFQITIDPPPIAQFTATTVCQGVATAFSSGPTSGNITNFSWNFNNPGGTSTVANPAFTYTTAGTFNAELTVTDNNGCVDDTTITVTVNANPVADVNDASVCNGSSATLTATGAGAGGGYLWSNGATTSSITVSPATTTTYTVTAITINGCQDTDQGTVSVNVMPVANAGSPVAFCQGGSTTLNGSGAGAGGTYSWSPATGLSDPTIANPVANPAATTTYTLTVTNGPGCTSSGTVLITVNNSPVANAGNPQAVCSGVPATLTASGAGAGGSYLWLGTGITTATITVTPMTTTTYSVQVTNSGGCPDTADVTVTVHPIPMASFINSGGVCEGGSITFTDQSNVSSGTITQWQWNFGNGNTATTQNPTTTYPNPGTPTVVLHITSSDGCTDSVTQVVSVYADPVANISDPAEICVGQSTSITASGAGSGGTYSWSPGAMTTATVSVNPGSTQLYTVTVTNAQGCSDVTQATVVVHPIPDASAGPDQTICNGNSTTLTGAGGASYLWTPGNFTTATITVSPGTTTSFNLIVTSAFGCQDRDTTVVTVNPLPVASFTSTAPVCQGNPVAFTDQSNVSSGTLAGWNWNFGNAGTSNSQNPSSTYNTSGPYTVQLIVTSGDGCIDTVIQNINIFGLPPADAGLNDEICEGENASLTATGGTQYLWNPGGLTTATINISPASTTPYNVTVTDGNGCSAADIASVIVNPLPVANAGNPQDICLGSSATLNASGGGPGGIYVWNPGNLTGASVTVTPGNTTNYTVLVTTAAGCQGTDQTSIEVNPIPVASFQNSGSVCQFYSINFTDQSTVSSGNITGWNWNFGNGTTSTDQDPASFYSNFGQFPVTLTVTTDAGCTHQTVTDVTVFEKPSALISAADVCDGIVMNFINSSSISDNTLLLCNWDLGDVTTTSAWSPTHLYTTFGHYPIQMIVRSINNCLDTMTFTANVNPLPDAALITESVCAMIPAEFNDASTVAEGNVTGWNWNFGDGATSTDQNAGHPYAEYGNYLVTLDVVTDHGCPDHTEFNLRVKPNPEPDFTAINDCVGKLTPFSDYSTVATGSVISWQWDFGDGSSSSDQNPIHLYPHSGFFDVTLTATSDSGCVTTYFRPAAVNVFPGPAADFTDNSALADDTYPFVQFFNLTSTTGFFFWTFGDGDSSNIFAPNHMYAEVGIYDVQLVTIDENGCVDTTLRTIEIKPTSTIYIPNAFTPNRDGVNDGFRPYFTNIVDLEVQVFDRWGLKICEWENLEGIWDGRYKGEMAQSDVYVYRVKTKDIRDKVETRIGHVTLVR